MTPAPPHAAAAVFGAALPAAERYVEWLATAGVERGLLGPREVPRIWQRHVLNSAAVAAAFAADATVVDIGSGAGLPGIPLALARPDLAVTLLEPLQRRVAFLDEVVADLGVSIVVQRGRVEELPPRTVPALVARAVAPLERLATLAVPALVPGGMLVALKGRSAEEEVEQAQPVLRRLAVASCRVVEFPVPEDAPTRAVVVVAGRRGRQR